MHSGFFAHDLEQAKIWLEKAAKLGHLEAKQELTSLFPANTCVQCHPLDIFRYPQPPVVKQTLPPVQQQQQAPERPALSAEQRREQSQMWFKKAEERQQPAAAAAVASSSQPRQSSRCKKRYDTKNIRKL